MTRLECNHLLLVLNKIKNPDEHVILAIKTVEKQLAIYDACKGAMKEYDYPY